MKKYLLKLAVFVTIFLVIAAVFFGVVDYGLRKGRYLDFAQWNEIYEGQINADVLIQGSSRAWRQVDPAIIDSVLGVNSYNLGMDGYQLPMQITRNKIYSAHNTKPKMIIQIVDHFGMWRRPDLFNRAQFLPYLDDTILANELRNYKGLTWPDYSIPYYRYIGSQEVALMGFLEGLSLKTTRSTRYKGFESSDKMWEPAFDVEKKNNPSGKYAPLSYEVYLQFDKYLADCRSRGIMVFLIYSPEFIEFQDYIINRDVISGIYAHLAAKHGFFYIDYKDHQLCSDKQFFYNPTHLNAKGAELFSLDLARLIRTKMK
jgi:hypothetical protein